MGVTVWNDEEMIAHLEHSIKFGTVNPIMITNIIQHHGISIMSRYLPRYDKVYFHAQVGSEEPENYTLSTDDNFDVAVAKAFKKYLEHNLYKYEEHKE